MTILPTNPLAREIAAVILAPVVPCAIIFLSGLLGGQILNSLGFSVLMLFYGEALAIFFGLPMLLILRRTLGPRLLYTTLAGGIIANVPWAITGIIGLIVAIMKSDFSALTPSFIALAVPIIFGTFCLGAVGAAIFWALATQPWARKIPQ